MLPSIGNLNTAVAELPDSTSYRLTVSAFSLVAASILVISVSISREENLIVEQKLDHFSVLVVVIVRVIKCYRQTKVADS